MDYGPAPESDEHVARLARRARSAASGISSAARSPSPATLFDVVQSRDGERIARVTQGTRGGRRRRGRRGAQGASQMGGALRPRARRASLRARAPRAEARALPRRARDDRQRQADPRDARHRHSAGRPAFLSSRRLGAAARRASSPATQPVGVVRPDHPVELPAADAGLEDRAGARGRQHGRAEAGRVHAADRARLRRDLRTRRACRRASSTSSPATARPARRSSSIRASTRSPSPARPRSAGVIRKATAGSGKKLSLELGGKSPFIVFDDADLDSAVEGVVDAIWFNQGQVCCAGSRLLVQEGVADALHRQAARAHGDAARRRSARQVDRHRRDRRAGPARAHPAARRSRARRKARRSGSADDALPDRGLLLSADAVHRRRAGVRRSRRRRSSARCWSR